MTCSRYDTDVFVVGGGPAGLSAAVAASRRGFSVMLADGARPPIDKACGEGLMPDSLTAAAKLGIAIPSSLGYAFRGIRFAGAASSVSAVFPDGIGRGIQRKLLHPILVEAAETAGVQLLWGAPVAGIEDHTIRLGFGSVRARWIIGADGNQSRVRRWAELGAVRHEARRFGFRSHYGVAPWSEYMEIHWGEHCQVYITPVACDEICLVLMSRDPHLRIADALPGFPALQERLQGAATTSPERGSFAATRRLRRVSSGHVALVGDASGTVDAITGEGLCLSFQQSLALADALAAGGLGRYEKAHSRISLRPVLMAEFMLLMDRSAWLRRQALRALSAQPELFAKLLAAHVGRLNPVALAATAAQLGWEIATE